MERDPSAFDRAVTTAADTRLMIQLVEFTTGLSGDEVRARIEERADEYRAVRGLHQKFYLRSLCAGQYAGIYIWADTDSLHAAGESDLELTVAAAFSVQGPLRVKTFEVMSVLH